MTDITDRPGNGAHPEGMPDGRDVRAAKLAASIAASAVLGHVDGAVPTTSQRFTVVLAPDAVATLDQLVACPQTLPDGRVITHFGIVAETSGHIEGASWASDTARIVDSRTMPGETARRVEVAVLRVEPEVWVSPAPGSVVVACADEARAFALFEDQMDDRLPVGLDQAGEPVHLDFAFLSGKNGGHVNIAGISGVATKTSYATFLLYQLFETERGRRILGPHAPNTRALVFNLKGEDLLHLDRPNRLLDVKHPEARRQWEALGVTDPGPFRDVTIWAPAVPGGEGLVPAVDSRRSDEVEVFGWTPLDFVSRGLLEFCFADESANRNQISFISQRVRIQLARHAAPVDGRPGALVLQDVGTGSMNNFERVAGEMARRDAVVTGGPVITDFGDLIDAISERVESDSFEWTAGVQQGTVQAFLRRLYALIPRMGHLVRCGVTAPDVGRSAITVVDLHALHDAAQRFVVGALLNAVFEAKQSSGREPLQFVVLDELNKYAPREGSSPLKELLVDVAERGRSLGVLLIGAEQAATAVDPAIVRNAAIKVVGRLDASEASEYRFLTPELRARATRFLPGTMVLDQPLVPVPIPLRFPFPGYATNVDEGRESAQQRVEAEDDAFAGIAGGAGITGRRPLGRDG
ncbi:MAG TPA: ATP-binding protein [Acidimicrobiales bacterium]|nr:ATP-binding protein [Acidimicrobiales bacterium]